MNTCKYLLHNAEVQIDFEYTEGLPPTWFSEGYPAQIDISAVFYKGVNIVACVSEEDIMAMWEFIEDQRNLSED